MRESLATISSKGQITLPKEVREQLGGSTHDRVAFVVEDDGTISVRAPKYPTFASLAGAAGSLKQPVSWEETRSIARDDYVAEEYPPRNP